MWVYLAIALVVAALATSAFISSPIGHLACSLFILAVAVISMYKTYAMVVDTQTAIAQMDGDNLRFQDSTALTFGSQWKVNNSMSMSNASAFNTLNSNMVAASSNTVALSNALSTSYSALRTGLLGMDANYAGITSNLSGSLTALSNQTQVLAANALTLPWGATTLSNLASLSNLTFNSFQTQTTATNTLAAQITDMNASAQQQGLQLSQLAASNTATSSQVSKNTADIVGLSNAVYSATGSVGLLRNDYAAFSNVNTLFTKNIGIFKDTVTVGGPSNAQVALKANSLCIGSKWCINAEGDNLVIRDMVADRAGQDKRFAFIAGNGMNFTGTATTFTGTN